MQNKIKILHTEWSDGWGGQEIRIVDESKEFIQRGYDVRVACQAHSQLFSECKLQNIPVFPIKLTKGLNLVAIVKLYNYIKKHHISIVHTHSSVDSRTAGIAAKLAGVKVVRSRHISVPIGTSRFTYFQYMKLADKIITSGEYIRNMMIERNNFLPERIVSAPAGINTEQFNLERPLDDIRQTYRLEGKYLVGIVSVLRSWKGHLYLIEAIHALKEEIPNIHLIIVGDGPQKANIEQQISTLGLLDYITLTGYQSDPAPYFKAMDVMVLPSYAGEATSQVLPQAMAMNTPVISTHAGGLAEVVIHEQTGLKIEPKDSESIMKAVLMLYNNPSLVSSIIESANALLLSKFTFTKMIDTTESTYKNLLHHG